jgi:hypothetical protein
MALRCLHVIFSVVASPRLRLQADCMKLSKPQRCESLIFSLITPSVTHPLYSDNTDNKQGLDESGLPSEAYIPTESGDHVPVDHSGYPIGPSGNATVFDAGGHH